MAKEKRATWWKMFYHQRAAIESVSDEDAGAGLKAAFRYFDGEDISPESLTAQAFTVFCVIRPYIDESFQDYNSCIESGKRGARNRWGKDSPPIDPHSPPIGCLREAEADILSSKDDRESRADKPCTPTRKKYGQYGWVKLTDSDYNRLLNDLGETEVKRCIAYVDESAQSNGNKNKWKDWNLVIRRCHCDGWGLSQQQSQPPQQPRRTGRLIVDEDGEERVIFE